MLGSNAVLGSQAHWRKHHSLQVWEPQRSQKPPSRTAGKRRDPVSLLPVLGEPRCTCRSPSPSPNPRLLSNAPTGHTARSRNSFGLSWGERAPRLRRSAVGRSSCTVPGTCLPSACCVLPAGPQMTHERRPRPCLVCVEIFSLSSCFFSE